MTVDSLVSLSSCCPSHPSSSHLELTALIRLCFLIKKAFWQVNEMVFVVVKLSQEYDRLVGKVKI